MKAVIVFFFLVTVYVLPVTAQEQRHYTCYRTAGPIVADGILDEPDWSLAEWSKDFVDITGNSLLKPPQRTRVRMLWDDSCLYVAAELRETDIWATLTQRDAVIFQDNDFEIFLDPDGNGMNYYEIEVNALATVWDLMLTRAYKDHGKPVNTWELDGMRTGIHIKGSLNDPVYTDTSWTVEMALPLASIMQGKKAERMPGEGVQWRINFSRVEWETDVSGPGYTKKTDPATGKNLPEKNWVWSPMGVVSMHIPEQWGWLEFSEENIRPGATKFRSGQQQENFRIWVWMGAHSQWTAAKWDSVLSDLHDAGITGVLTQADTAILGRMIPIAKRYGITVEKWFVALMNNDPGLIKEHPEWFVVNREGKSSVTDPAYVGYYRFLCPANPNVQAYLRSHLDAYLKIPGLSGIHLDYIRFPDVILPEGLWPVYKIVQDREYPRYDYCYCAICRDKFRALTGRDPMTMDHPDQDSAWRQFRYDRVTLLVTELAASCHDNGKTISSAVFPGPSTAKKLVRQEWNQWPLDEVMPMLYQNFYYGSLDWIRSETAEGTGALPKTIPLYSGLYVPALGPRELQSAILKSVAGGAAGISLFNYESMTPAHWKALKESLDMTGRHRSK